MNCSNCIKVNPVPTCSLEWKIGQVDVSYSGEILLARLTNLATGRVEIFDTLTVGVDGSVTVTAMELMDHYYKIELIDSVNTNYDLSVDADEGCCIEFTTYPHSVDETVIFSTDQCAIS